MSTTDDLVLDPEADDVTDDRDQVDGDPTMAAEPRRPRSVADEIRTARFREKLRGYSPDDVDGFLEQLAVVVEGFEAELSDLRERMRDAEERLAVASAGEQTVRRTLTLAQRTAELAIAEAQERAAQIVGDAEEEARARVVEVEQECAGVRAREAGRLEAEVARLTDARASAREQLALLEARRAAEHARLTEILRDLSLLVDARLRADEGGDGAGGAGEVPAGG